MYRFYCETEKKNNAYGETNKAYKTSAFLEAVAPGLGFRPPPECSLHTSWTSVFCFSSGLSKLFPLSDPNLQTLSQYKPLIQNIVVGTGEVTEVAVTGQWTICTSEDSPGIGDPGP